MNTDKILALIEGSNLSPMQKLSNKGFIERAALYEVERKQAREFVESIASINNLQEILLDTKDYVIYTVRGKDWDSKYPFRYIYKNGEDKWYPSSKVCATLETAILSCLGEKHLGSNSQFMDFASKMLEIGK